MTDISFDSLLRLSIRWDIGHGVATFVLVAALALALTGCASTGSIQAVVINDPDSGYDTGFGLSVDAVTRGTFTLATRATLANVEKAGADTGYTYSGSAGVRYGSRFFGELGGIWYGYESQFADGATWAKSRSTWYAATGVSLPNWQGVLRYYPSPGDSYDVQEIAIESRHHFGRWLLTIEPGIYEITIAGRRKTSANLRAGVGWRW